MTITLILLALAAAPAAAWGPGFHAYVADNVGKGEPLNLFEVYGALLPDVCYFAYDLEAEDQAACAAVVHEPYAPWEAALYPWEKALGFGYASHNNDWGADRTAHHPLWGYIATRARVMAVMLKGIKPLDQLPFATREAISHTVLEAATDILIKRIDSQIGVTMATATCDGPWTAWVPEYLAEAYGDPPGLDLAARVESFRGLMCLYGGALALPTDYETKWAIATIFAQFAPFWLPEGMVLEDPDQMIFDLLTVGMTMTQKDFPYALQATTRRVRWNLWWHGVWY